MRSDKLRCTMHVLVTGGAGFAGSWFVRAALAGEYPFLGDADVTVFDKLTYAGSLDNLADVREHPRFRFVRGDICAPTDLDAALPGHDLVVNFAAETHVDRSLRTPGDFVTTNVLGAQQLLDAAIRHGVQRVVHVSTDEVYGPVPTGSKAREDDPLRPTSPYAASKAAADLIARAYATSFGLDVRITRASNTYGPHQYPEKLIPLFVTRLLRGERVPLYGDGEQRRQWLWVGDHCRAVAIVAERGQPGGVYNVGGGTELSNRELTQRLLEATGRRWEDAVEHVPDPRGAAHDSRYAVDGTRLEKLGYQPGMPFEQGLADTIRWLQAAGRLTGRPSE
jgi:dTDP-glucose 4,6-dehydratase